MTFLNASAPPHLPYRRLGPTAAHPHHIFYHSLLCTSDTPRFFLHKSSICRSARDARSLGLIVNVEVCSVDRGEGQLISVTMIIVTGHEGIESFRKFLT